MYIITQSYGGQLTRAIRNMMVQQCWVRSTFGSKAVIVEPFSQNSELLHSPQIWSDLKGNKLHTMAKFSNYYDMHYYNKQSMQEDSAPLISWEIFLNEAPRKAVIFNIPTHKCDKTISYKTDNCTFSGSFSLFIEALSEMGFETIKNVCITCSKLHQPLKAEDLIDMLFSEHNFEKITIFINSGRNFKFTLNLFQIPLSCKSVENPRSSNRLIPSAMIVHHSQCYINKFIKKNYATAIMLRTERFFGSAATGHLTENLESCLNKTLLLNDKLKKSASHGTFITVDIGRYGSGIMQNERSVHRLVNGSIKSITQSIELIFGKVFNGKVSFEDWQNTFAYTTGGFIERGYIAMLQQHIASQSQCLILMGGGSFQQVAAFQYLGNHKLCLHTVCTRESFRHLFSHSVN